MTTRERAEAVRAAATEIDAAIVAKGGETPGGLRNAAAAIAALPSGGGKCYDISERWPNKPTDWFELRDEIEDRTDPTNAKYDGHQYAYAMMVPDFGEDTTQFLGGVAYRTSDGAFYSSGGTVSHTWDKSKDAPCSLGYATRWYIVYGDAQKMTIPIGGVPETCLWFVGNKATTVSLYNSSFGRKLLGYIKFLRAAEANFLTDNTVGWHNFRDDTALEYVNRVDFGPNENNDTLSFFGCTALTYIRVRNAGTRPCHDASEWVRIDNENPTEAACRITGDTTMMEAFPCTNLSFGTASFQNLRKVTKLPRKMTVGNGMSFYAVFIYSASLIRMCDELDATRAVPHEHEGGAFTGCVNITNLPTVVNSVVNLPFKNLTGFSEPDTLAKFDAGGNIVGGLAVGINTTDNALTITLNNKMRSYFDDTQWDAIVAAFGVRGWTVAIG